MRIVIDGDSNEPLETGFYLPAPGAIFYCEACGHTVLREGVDAGRYRTETGWLHDRCDVSDVTATPAMRQASNARIVRQSQRPLR